LNQQDHNISIARDLAMGYKGQDGSSKCNWQKTKPEQGMGAKEKVLDNALSQAVKLEAVKAAAELPAKLLVVKGQSPPWEHSRQGPGTTGLSDQYAGSSKMLLHTKLCGITPKKIFILILTVMRTPTLSYIF
jgi:hypothetical protein